LNSSGGQAVTRGELNKLVTGYVVEEILLSFKKAYKVPL
jgi:hypothetical protein